MNLYRDHFRAPPERFGYGSAFLLQGLNSENDCPPNTGQGFTPSATLSKTVQPRYTGYPVRITFLRRLQNDLITTNHRNKPSNGTIRCQTNVYTRFYKSARDSGQSRALENYSANPLLE